MATRGKKISEQTLATNLDGNEIIPFAKNGADGAVKVSKLLSKTVAPEEGKGLSTNDFTNEYKAMIEQNSDKIISLENKHAQFALPGFWRPDGTIGTDTNYSRTGLIPINKKHGITVDVAGTKNVAALAMFDASGVCIWYRKPTDTEGTVRTTITVQAEDIPSNAVYFSACTHTGYGNLAKCSWSNGGTMEARESAISDVVQRSKKLLFIDQWTSLGKIYIGTLNGSYDAATDKFNLKWDYKDEHAKKYMPSVTYEEAVAMMQNIRGSVLGFDELSVIAPANLPPKGYQTGSGPYFNVQRSEVSLYNKYMEVLILATQPNGTFSVYQNQIQLVSLSLLKAVIGVATTSSSWNPLIFSKGSGIGFPKLEFFRVQIKQSFDVSTSPLLTLDTMQYLVTYAQNTSPITVTVHPDVYAKITDETNTEWHALMTDGAAKQITFATTT